MHKIRELIISNTIAPPVESAHFQGTIIRSLQSSSVPGGNGLHLFDLLVQFLYFLFVLVVDTAKQISQIGGLV